MGSCFSKKTVSAACPVGEVQLKREEKKEEDEREEKKEVFVIKHRDSHERRSPSPSPSPEVVLESGKVSTTTSMAVRTSSCTKEEVEAILIQCGRLSRNNSFGTPGKAVVAGGGGGGSLGRRYSGSKRSFDFDNEEGEVVVVDEARDSRREQRHSRRVILSFCSLIKFHLLLIPPIKLDPNM
ncbi:Uncharacterized protein At1g65710 [Linum perenne]